MIKTIKTIIYFPINFIYGLIVVIKLIKNIHKINNDLQKTLNNLKKGEVL